jgi:hypothetical protein
LHLCKKSFILPWKEILDESSACTNKKTKQSQRDQEHSTGRNFENSNMMMKTNTQEKHNDMRSNVVPQEKWRESSAGRPIACHTKS